MSEQASFEEEEQEEEQDALSDFTEVEGEYNLNTHRTYEPDTITIASATDRPIQWDKFKTGLQKGQTHRKIVNATKSRDAKALRAVLSDHYFGNKNEAETHLGQAQDEDNTLSFTLQLVGISELWLSGQDEKEDFSRYGQHFALIKAVQQGRPKKLQEELVYYKQQRETLKKWPLNFGVFDFTFSAYTDLDLDFTKLRQEWQVIMDSFERDFPEIDKLLGKQLLEEAEFYKENMSDRRYNKIKKVLEGLIKYDTESRAEGIESVAEEREGGESGTKPPQNEFTNTPDTDMSDEDDKKYALYDAKKTRQRRKAEANDARLNTEIEEAVVMLQMLRIKSTLNKARFTVEPEENPTDTYEHPDAIKNKIKQIKKQQKKDFKSAIRECEDFLQEAKHAINAARELLTDRRKENESETPKQADVTATYQASNSQKKQLQIQKELKDRMQREDERKSYIYHKGRKMKVKKQDPWTQRNNWDTLDKDRQKEFKDLLKNHPDLKGYIGRIKAAIDELYTDLADAKKDEKDLQAAAVPRRSLDLDRNTMSEVRRYVNPPAHLHGIVQAMMLLLGEDEYATMEWSNCKALLNPHSDARNIGLSKRILRFDSKGVHLRIAMRAREILHDIPFDEALKTSPAAGAYYVWTMGVLDEMGVPKPKTPREGASPDEQLEIFRKPPRRGGKGTRYRRDPSPNKADLRYGGHYKTRDHYS